VHVAGALDRGARPRAAVERRGHSAAARRRRSALAGRVPGAGRSGLQALSGPGDAGASGSASDSCHYRSFVSTAAQARRKDLRLSSAIPFREVYWRR